MTATKGRRRWSLVLAAAALALLCLGAFGAGLLSSCLSGFSYAEVDTAAPLMPAGTMSVKQTHREYDGETAAFVFLDHDGSGAIECLGRGPGFSCAEFERANETYSRVKRRWSRAGTRQERTNGISRDKWMEALERVPQSGLRTRLAAESVDSDGDGKVTHNEFVTATAFLTLDEEDARAMDENGDALITEGEFLGAPVASRHLMGTDSLGRDLFARLLYGLRVSITVALCATLVSFLIGTILGLASGFAGGTFDKVFLRVLEVLQAIPFIFVVILISVFSRDIMRVRFEDPEAQAFTQSVVIFCALGAIQWFSLARYARGLAFSLRSADFARALSGMGFSTARIVLKHLLPNALVPLLAYAVLLVPTLVLEEAFLSFLGFGIQPPYPSLGILLNDGVVFMDISPGMLLLPAMAILLLTWSLNVMGETLSGRQAGGQRGWGRDG